MMHLPHYTQHYAMDCSPTCLRMIAAHYGCIYSLENLRENIGFSKSENEKIQLESNLILKTNS